MRRWSIATATTVGESHTRRGRGSDDAFATLQSGRWNAIVVCDGAGSAARSREGADRVSSAFARELIKISKRIENLGPGPWLNDSIISSVLAVREELATFVQSFDLREFHCTVVAALISDTGGFSVHIGDGAVFVGRRTDLVPRIELHSEPENGEYSNETFFVTETTWLKNLRIKPLGACDWVMLTTDGASALLLDQEIKFGVFSGLLEVLSTEKNLTKVCDDLSYFTESDYATACSNDDKTIVLAFRGFSCLKDYDTETLEPDLSVEEAVSKVTSESCKSNRSLNYEIKPSLAFNSQMNPLRFSALLRFGSIIVFVVLVFLILYAYSKHRDVPVQTKIDLSRTTMAPCVKATPC
ncbi:MAG: protein phosphatase 2C domain-containing protein [Porticoccaceae bacterium]|nr:protein phosphatase 2C domain-containing protein [Porticoccaceae bacterium]